MKTNRFILSMALGLGLMGARAQVQGQDGKAVIQRLIEVNRYWLLEPPPSIERFRYQFHRFDAEPETISVQTPVRAADARRQGITYVSLLHHLASKPEQVTVRELREEDGRWVLSLEFDPPLKGHCGNGISGSWCGYFNLGGEHGQLIVDKQRLVPIKSVLGALEEVFEDYVQMGDGHWAPLSVHVHKADSMEFSWKFRVYEPGLWLLDYSEYGSRKVAWIDQAAVNQAPAELANATATSVQRAQAEREGGEEVRQFLQANRHWLAPSLQKRRGLVYDYTQEAPYRERVWFDPEGRVAAQLESSKETPSQPTRQRLWLVDGRQIASEANDPYVRIPALEEVTGDVSRFFEDRALQHLAMGLALDCALTRLAREPDSFWAERLPVEGAPDQVRLVLHSTKDTRLFAGTMLLFTSWAYMHDVRYERAEILCDTATRRPLEEKLFSADDELKGHVVYEEYQQTPDGAVPMRIRIRVPYEKEGQDQSLEVDAQFQIVRDNIWLLDQVASAFRGSGDGSTGRVRLVEQPSFEPVQELVERYRKTQETLEQLQKGVEGTVTVELEQDEWTPLMLRADWSEEATKSIRSREEGRGAQADPLIGLQRVKLSRQVDGGLALAIAGITTTYNQEFRTDWRVVVLDENNREVAQGESTIELRCQRVPGAFTNTVELAAEGVIPPGAEQKVRVEGKVQSMTGAYHGHGMWLRFAQ